jgi:hypothetical protein
MIVRFQQKLLIDIMITKTFAMLYCIKFQVHTCKLQKKFKLSSTSDGGF